MAHPDVYAVLADETLDIGAPGVLANDVDPDGEAVAVEAIQDDIDHGDVSLSADGQLTYTPDEGFTGTDAFSYVAQDGSGNQSDPVTATIAVVEGTGTGSDQAGEALDAGWGQMGAALPEGASGPDRVEV